MLLNFREKRTHTIIDVEGNLSLSDFFSFKNAIEELLKKDVNHIDLNLSNTKSIDSSSLRLLVNLHKRLSSQNKNFSLFNLTEQVQEVLKSTNLIRVFKVFKTEKDLDDFILSEGKTKEIDCWELAEAGDDPIKRVSLKCAICGSVNVFGYALSPQHRKKVWNKTDFLPLFEGLENNEDMDFGRAQIAVCSDCFMASISLTDFDIFKDNKKVYESSIDSGAKSRLARGIGKRKKIMELSVAVGDNFFNLPRSDVAVMTAYKLAEECARTIVSERSETDAFLLAYFNIMAGEYAPQTDERLYFEHTRAWLSEMFENIGKYSTEQIAEGYYYMFISCLRIDKRKEARNFFEKLKQLENTTKDSFVRKSISFWYERAQQILQNVIENDSPVLHSS